MNDEQYNAFFEEVFRETEERVPDLTSILEPGTEGELPVLRKDERVFSEPQLGLYPRKRLLLGMVAGITLLAVVGLALFPAGQEEADVAEPMATYLDLGSTDFLQPRPSGLSDWRSSTDFLLNVE